jgi:hypothetical protein
MIFKIFSPKKLQNKAELCKILITTLSFEKNDNFFAENCQKSQKIVIIPSTPGRNAQLLDTTHKVTTDYHIIGTQVGFDVMTMFLQAIF